MYQVPMVRPGGSAVLYQTSRQDNAQLGGIFDTIWGGIKTAAGAVGSVGGKIVQAGVGEIFGPSQVPVVLPDGRVVYQQPAVGGGTSPTQPIIIQTSPATAGFGIDPMTGLLIGGGLLAVVLLSRRR